MEGQQRRVEQHGPQDEQGGPEGLHGEDLSHPQNDAVCHLGKRVESGEAFTLQQEPRQMAHGDDFTLAFAVKTTATPFCKRPREVFPWQRKGCAISMCSIYKC